VRTSGDAAGMPLFAFLGEEGEGRRQGEEVGASVGEAPPANGHSVMVHTKEHCLVGMRGTVPGPPLPSPLGRHYFL